MWKAENYCRRFIRWLNTCASFVHDMNMKLIERNVLNDFYYRLIIKVNKIPEKRHRAARYSHNRTRSRAIKNKTLCRTKFHLIWVRRIQRHELIIFWKLNLKLHRVYTFSRKRRIGSCILLLHVYVTFLAGSMIFWCYFG